MYNSKNIGFVQPEAIGTTYAREDVPLGSVFRFGEPVEGKEASVDTASRNNIYLALGTLPPEADVRCPRVSFMLKPDMKKEILINLAMSYEETGDMSTEVSDFGSRIGHLDTNFGTFSLSFKNQDRPTTILGAFNFGWLAEDVPTVRMLGTELGRFVSFKDDKINPDEPEKSESNLYLVLGASPDFQLSTAKDKFGEDSVLLMKVTNKDQSAPFSFIVKNKNTVCVSRGIATLNVMC